MANYYTQPGGGMLKSPVDSQANTNYGGAPFSQTYRSGDVPVYSSGRTSGQQIGYAPGGQTQQRLQPQSASQPQSAPGRAPTAPTGGFRMGAQNTPFNMTPFYLDPGGGVGGPIGGGPAPQWQGLQSQQPTPPAPQMSYGGLTTDQAQQAAATGQGGMYAGTGGPQQGPAWQIGTPGQSQQQNSIDFLVHQGMPLETARAIAGGGAGAAQAGAAWQNNPIRAAMSQGPQNPYSPTDPRYAQAQAYLASRQSQSRAASAPPPPMTAEQSAFRQQQTAGGGLLNPSIQHSGGALYSPAPTPNYLQNQTGYGGGRYTGPGQQYFGR